MNAHHELTELNEWRLGGSYFQVLHWMRSKKRRYMGPFVLVAVRDGEIFLRQEVDPSEQWKHDTIRWHGWKGQFIEVAQLSKDSSLFKERLPIEQFERQLKQYIHERTGRRRRSFGQCCGSCASFVSAFGGCYDERNWSFDNMPSGLSPNQWCHYWQSSKG
jgi:hypothetical protein